MAEERFDVRVSRSSPGVQAECEQCDFHRDKRGTSAADNARAAAKRHVATTGHTVYVERSIGTYLAPSPKSRTGGRG